MVSKLREPPDSGSSNADINDDTTYSVLVTKDEARLAGWDLIPGALRSGTVADINGNQAKIALGQNATSTFTSTLHPITSHRIASTWTSTLNPLS